MSTSLTLSFRKDITLTLEEENIILQSPQRRLTFHKPQPGLKAALNNLNHSSNTVFELRQLVVQTDGVEGGDKFDSYLQRLITLGWICQSVSPLGTAIPMVEDYQLDYPEFDWEQARFTLSRFAYLHQVDGDMLLESPLSKAKVMLSDWRAAALVAKLSQPQTCAGLISGIPEITEDIAQQFISLLLANKMLSLEETEKLNLITWEFQNLLFHSRTRVGRHNYPWGGTYPFVGKIEPLPAVKSPMSDKVIKLFQPNLEELAKTDISVTQALESRRSIRRYNDNPITIEQLGELLYRCARVKEIIPTEMGEQSRRPYPGGGAMYELEIYPVINTCQGIDRGVYHYQPLSHELYQISEWNQEAEKLIKDAWYASGQHDIPQMILVITAKFRRMFWKYQSMPYAAILKHVGVLYQSFYLVATAMNLAPCALGSGNSDLFAKVTGLDYYEESSVGEFMLGARKQKHKQLDN